MCRYHVTVLFPFRKLADEIKSCVYVVVAAFADVVTGCKNPIEAVPRNGVLGAARRAARTKCL